MKRLLQSFSSRLAIAAALLRRGQHRILRTQDASFLQLLCDHRCADEAWRIAFMLGFFLHMGIPILPGISRDLNTMSDALVVQMNIPDVISIPLHGDRVLSIEAVCLVLDRRAYPRKWDDLEQRYDRHTSALSRIFNCMLHCILKAANDRILFVRTLSPARMQAYAQALLRRALHLNVTDVKKVKNSRPTHDQRAQLSGHTKYHWFKYQTLETPDDVLLVGRVDLSLLSLRGWSPRRRLYFAVIQFSTIPDAQPDIIRGRFVVFGDSAYPNNVVMITMFRGRNLTT
ncbi:TPA: hypothetical protein N0F65_004433 [Lagenidium giganteum]|uniref:DDE Tnp4 domain-containing protein n=1 Tax=Lagenidium giganteum TaxID=4803 RepID=A0AAV2ZBI3_9STRA|nr:TPA: hypothetical protein N0F65_004433 [Lagenidium giganteum]